MTVEGCDRRDVWFGDLTDGLRHELVLVLRDALRVFLGPLKCLKGSLAVSLLNESHCQAVLRSCHIPFECIAKCRGIEHIDCAEHHQ